LRNSRRRKNYEENDWVPMQAGLIFANDWVAMQVGLGLGSYVGNLQEWVPMQATILCFAIVL
jgi:hypothetical protein